MEEVRCFIKKLMEATSRKQLKWKQRKVEVRGPYASHSTRKAESYFDGNVVILEKIEKEQAFGHTFSSSSYILKVPARGINFEGEYFHFLFFKSPLVCLAELIGLDKEIAFPYSRRLTPPYLRRSVIEMSTEPFD